jgi:hypothetical protein
LIYPTFPPHAWFIIPCFLPPHFSSLSNRNLSFPIQEIDGKALLLLTQEMLESLTENKLGPMTKIHNAVRALKQSWGIW